MQPVPTQHASPVAPAKGAPAGDLSGPLSGPLSGLRRFARAAGGGERCELCGRELEGEHPHLLDPGPRRILCACRSCSILFSGQEGARLLAVPRRVVALGRFSFTDAEWERMMLPIGLAFFLHGADGSATAVYPSPAGAMESLIALPPWRELFEREPVAREAEPVVEAVLVNRTGVSAGAGYGESAGGDPACLLVPIDVCYRLVGLVRTGWQGLSGGRALREQLDGFFSGLGQRAAGGGERGHA